MSSGPIAVSCPFLEGEPGCSRGPTRSGAPFPRTGSWALSGASSAPFTCQDLGKLKSSVGCNRRKRRRTSRRRELQFPECREEGALQRAHSPGSRVPAAGALLLPDPPPHARRRGSGRFQTRAPLGGSGRRVEGAHGCFEFLHLCAFCDFPSRSQIRTHHTIASPK